MVDKSRFHVSSVDSAPGDSQDGFLYRNSFFSLSCPICLSKICGLASECNFHPNCNFCHEEDHLQEDGNQLIEYLKLDYSGEGKFSSSQNLMIAGLSTSNEIHDLVVNHIREYSVTVSSKKSESVPEVEYIDALICVAIKIDIDEETLQRLSNFDPDSIHWARKRGQDLIRPAEEIVSKYRDSTIPLNLETKESSVYDYIKESNNFLDEMNKSKIDSNSAKKIILIFSDGFNQYGVQRQLKFLMDCLHGKGFQHTIPEFDSWIISKWFAILISSTAQKQNISEHISLRVLENMETRAAESNEYWVAFQISQMILEKAIFATDDENQQNIFKRVLGYFEYLKDLTNYITYCRMIVDTGLTIEISFPDWIEEKLINLPEQIPKFDNLCEILNIEFDYSPIIQNLPKDSFANVLGINHLSKILATGDKINFSSSEGYSERMLIGGDGSQGNLINFESPLEEATGFTIDLPNLLYLTKDRSDNKTRMKEWITATNKIINWINQNQTPCYIHTTPTTCWSASECVNKIFKETNAYFLYYEFEDTKDEDLYFLSFSLRRNTWLVSQDTFRNHSSTIDSTILDSIGNRLFMPRYNPETEEIEFIKF